MERRRMAGTINKCITGHEMFFIYVLKSYSTADWCSQRISEDKVLNHSKGLRILFSLSSLLNLVYTPLDQSLSLHFISGSLPTPPITRGLRWLSSTPTSESISFSLSLRIFASFLGNALAPPTDVPAWHGADDFTSNLPLEGKAGGKFKGSLSFPVGGLGKML